MALNINGTTGISGVDGSVSAPAVKGTDGNTGLSFGTDVIDLNTGGSSRFKIGAAGQLGVAGANYGSSGQALISQGASAAPQWSTVGGGKIVKYVTSGSVTTTKSTSGSTKTDCVNQTITPASSSNKILVLASCNVYIYVSSNAFSGFDIYRGDISSGTAVFTQYGGGAHNTNRYSSFACNFIDSPNTTSAQLYTLAISRSSGNTNYVSTDGQAYTLTLIELEP